MRPIGRDRNGAKIEESSLDCVSFDAMLVLVAFMLRVAMNDELRIF